MHYRAQQPWTPLSESLLDWDMAFHDLMLHDRLRMNAYRKAIFEVVRPGDRVMDLGTGTGILSQWALEAGAACVIGVDMNSDVLQQAVMRLADAGYGQRFVAINQMSYDVQLAERVDVLISEIIGNVGDNENFQPILEDAVRRLLKPEGVLLPRSVCSYLVPVTAAQAHQCLCRNEIKSLSPRYGAKQLYRQKNIQSAFDIYYDCILPLALYLSQPQRMYRYGAAWDQASTYTRELVFQISTAGSLTGFKGYFAAELSEHTMLDISGDDIAAGLTSDSWKHAYFPVQTPIDMKEGDVLRVWFSRRGIDTEGRRFQQVYEWKGEVERDGRVVGRFFQRMPE